LLAVGTLFATEIDQAVSGPGTAGREKSVAANCVSLRAQVVAIGWLAESIGWIANLGGSAELRAAEFKAAITIMIRARFSLALRGAAIVRGRTCVFAVTRAIDAVGVLADLALQAGDFSKLEASISAAAACL